MALNIQQILIDNYRKIFVEEYLQHKALIFDKALKYRVGSSVKLWPKQNQSSTFDILQIKKKK